MYCFIFFIFSQIVSKRGSLVIQRAVLLPCDLVKSVACQSLTAAFVSITYIQLSILIAIFERIVVGL